MTEKEPLQKIESREKIEWPFVMVNVCMDRGAGRQLQDFKYRSYDPWAHAIEGIFKEEVVHVYHGETGRLPPRC